MDDASLKRTNDVPRFVQHKTILRLIALTLLIISIMGPWMFDMINVPAEYTCSSPFIRFYGDFCGMPVSGVLFFGLFIGGLLIPFFTTTLFIWKKETPRLRTVNLVAWIIALIPTAIMFCLSLVQYREQALQLWGLWLYILTALGTVIFETTMLKRKADNT